MADVPLLYCSLSLLFETRSRSELEARLGSLTSELLGSSYLSPPTLGLQAHVAMPGFYVGTEDMHSGPTACMTNALTH